MQALDGYTDRTAHGTAYLQFRRGLRGYIRRNCILLTEAARMTSSFYFLLPQEGEKWYLWPPATDKNPHFSI